MEKSVVVLGAKGRFGRNAVAAFHSAGWHVVAVGRDIDPGAFPEGIAALPCDVMDQAATVEVCKAADIVVNAVNPPYTDWAETVPTLTDNVIAAAQSARATVMIPGNVYNYGAGMPAVLTEDTPHRPTTSKGKIRVEMERRYREATGIQTIVFRGGDFIEGRDTGNWFESYITNALNKGVFIYPGSMDVMHAWAFLPDLARAMVHLANIQDKLPNFCEFGFGGTSITGADLQTEIEAQLGRKLKRKRMHWGVIKLLSLFQPMMREVLEMRYLWDVPHQIDDAKLRVAIPDFQPTPLTEVVAKAIGR